MNKIHLGLLRFLLSGFGIGFIPWAPGTWGSALGIFLVLLVSYFPIADMLIFFVLLLITSTLISIYLKGSSDKDPDPQFIILDEVLGIFITFIAMPLTWVTLLLGFILFRCFDIFKPLGIRKLERTEGPWGIILDDLAAGILAHIILRIYIWSGAPI